MCFMRQQRHQRKYGKNQINLIESGKGQTLYVASGSTPSLQTLTVEGRLVTYQTCWVMVAEVSPQA